MISRFQGIFSRHNTHRNSVSFNDISIFATATGTGTTSALVTWPASITSGMVALLYVTNKLHTSRPYSVSGFRRVDTGQSSTLNNATDRGPIVASLFERDCEGGESGDITVSVPNGNSVLAVLIVVQKDPSANLLFQFAWGHHNAIGTTSYSAQSWRHFNLLPDDFILTLSGVNCDTYGWGSEGLNQTGTTFEEMIEEIHETSSNQGNDQEQFASLYKVTSSGGSGPLIHTATSTGASVPGENPTGMTMFVRIRQSTETHTWLPSGLRINLASEVTETVASGEGTGSIWDGQRISQEGPSSSAFRFYIEEFESEPCFVYEVDLTLGANRRSETFIQPLAPDYIRGSQFILERLWKTGAVASSTNLSEWIMHQIHPGSADGFFSNHPTFYIAWAHEGQTGFDNAPGYVALGGELEVVQNLIINPPTNNTIRHVFPSIVFQPNTSYRVFYHYKGDYAADDIDFPGSAPCAKVKVNGTLIYENYTDATITKEDADLGSRSNVLGSPKEGLYLHGVNDDTDADNEVAAGFSGVKLLSPRRKYILQFPGDVDYIQDADLADNDNPIYAFVDTTTD